MTTFEDAQLVAILAKQREPVQVRHPRGHVEIHCARASDAVRLVRDGGYVGVGHRKRIRYVQPYTIEARKEPWATDRELFAATRPLRPPVSKSGGTGGLGRRCGDSTLHTLAVDPSGRRGIVIRRV